MGKSITVEGIYGFKTIKIYEKADSRGLKMDMKYTVKKETESESERLNRLSKEAADAFYEDMQEAIVMILEAMQELRIPALHTEDIFTIAGEVAYSCGGDCEGDEHKAEWKKRDKIYEMLYFAPKDYSKAESTRLKPRLYAFLNTRDKPMDELMRELQNEKEEDFKERNGEGK